MQPNNRIISVNTVANTGRRMLSSDMFMNLDVVVWRVAWQEDCY